MSVDLNARPRPADHRGNVCGFTFRGKGCRKKGAHYCEPRADKAVTFFREHLFHVAGGFAGKPFILEEFQEWDIVRPLFGEVAWTEWGAYGRRYSIASIVLSRKNGKSELLSAIAIYLLVADGEQSAQVFAAAIDTEQARVVFDPAAFMVKQNAELRQAIDHNKQTRRLIFPDRNSFFAVIPADAEGALGSNPHGVIIDEVLNQPNAKLYNALRTGMGSRLQPLLILATTETDNGVSFGASMIDQAERIQEDPSRAWHHFAYVRKLPRTVEEVARLERLFPGHPDLPVISEEPDGKGGIRQFVDVFDERNWKWPNPALDTFLKRKALREEAQDARDNLANENSFRQYRMNQRVQQATRYISMDLWRKNSGDVVAHSPEEIREILLGKQAWAGLDLSSKLDLTAWAMLFPDGEIFTRLWIPESRVAMLVEATDGRFGQWVSQGWITPTDGDTIDYQQVYSDIESDATDFAITRVVYDKWSGEPVRQEIERRTGVEMVESDTTFQRMTNPMNEITRALTARELRHFGNPVLEWMADNLEAIRPHNDPDRVRPVKPQRDASGKHIDGMMALLYAIDSKLSKAEIDEGSAYETRGVRVV